MPVINQIMDDAGFVDGKTYKETRFVSPPSSTYAVYNVSKRSVGADDGVMAYRLDVTVELYEYKPDKKAVAALEAAIERHAAELIDGYEKQERFWIDTETLYQTIYEFSYYEKK